MSPSKILLNIMYDGYFHSHTDHPQDIKILLVTCLNMQNRSQDKECICLTTGNSWSIIGLPKYKISQVFRKYIFKKLIYYYKKLILVTKNTVKIKKTFFTSLNYLLQDKLCLSFIERNNFLSEQMSFYQMKQSYRKQLTLFFLKESWYRKKLSINL